LKKKLILLAIVLAATLIRVYNIEQKNLWFDEVFSWHISQGTVEEIVIETSGDIHPPFYYIVLKFWINIFSDSIVSMRMLSVLMSILSMYFIYKISILILKNENHAFVVLILFALSPLNLLYSQEVRMLSLNLFLCLGSVYFFLTFLNKEKLLTGILFVLFTVLSLYTHYFSLLILFTELIILLIYFRKSKFSLSNIRNKIILLITSFILYIPWIPTFLKQTNKGQPWRKEQSLLTVLNSVSDFFKDIFVSSYYKYENSMFINYTNVFSLFVITFIFYLLFKILNFRKNRDVKIVYDILLFFIPLTIAILISINQSILLSRYLSITIPFLYIFIVYSIFYLFKIKTSVIILVLFIITNFLGIYIYNNNNFKNNDYRKIISHIESGFNEGDQIIAEPHFMGWSINYHMRHNKSELTKPEVYGWNLKMQTDSLKNITDKKNYWFITDYSSLENNNYDSLAYIMNSMGYTRISEKTFYVIPSKVKVEYFKITGKNSLIK